MEISPPFFVLLDFLRKTRYNKKERLKIGESRRRDGMENEKQIKKPELLCPAGSSAALAAAIEGGADAIYLGGVAFNARIHAKNFTHDELRDGISLAHAYGAKVYVTANTLIYDTIQPLKSTVFYCIS